jgi:hypothetical protein
MESSHPILIGGTGRCGTSILGAMLMESPKIFPFFEPDALHRLFVRYFLRVQLPFGLSRQIYANRLSRSLIYSANWYRLQATEPLEESFSAQTVNAALEASFRDCRRTGDYLAQFDEFCGRLLGGFVSKAGRKRWCVKQPGYLYKNLDTVYRMHPKMRFIHIVRDGRDVISSMVEQPWAKRWPKPMRFAMALNKWSKTLVRGARLEKDIPKGQFLTVRFEDLINDTDYVLSSIFEFVGEESSFSLEYFGLKDDRRGNNFDKNKAHVRRFQENLSSDQVSIIEGRYGYLLSRYDYV